MFMHSSKANNVYNETVLNGYSFCQFVQVKQAVIWALQAGYRHIDCAVIYGNEVEIGEALQETLGSGKVNTEPSHLNLDLFVYKGDIL